MKGSTSGHGSDPSVVLNCRLASFRSPAGEAADDRAATKDEIGPAVTNIASDNLFEQVLEVLLLRDVKAGKTLIERIRKQREAVHCGLTPGRGEQEAMAP